jgi:hypothetical protein
LIDEQAEALIQVQDNVEMIWLGTVEGTWASDEAATLGFYDARCQLYGISIKVVVMHGCEIRGIE